MRLFEALQDIGMYVILTLTVITVGGILITGLSIILRILWWVFTNVWGI